MCGWTYELNLQFNCWGSAIIKMAVQVSLLCFIMDSIECIPKDGTVVSYSGSVFYSLRNYHSVSTVTGLIGIATSFI